MNVIENSRKGAAERSAENYVRAVETAVVEARMDNVTASGTYTIMEDGNLCQGAVSGTTCDGTKLTVEVSGNKPEAGGTVKIENGSVAADGDTAMTIGDYTVSYNEEGKLEASKGNEGSDVVTLSDVCDYQGEDENAKYTYGAEYTCVLGGENITFYVLEDGDATLLTTDTGRIAQDGQVSLIMDSNITDSEGNSMVLPWCSQSGSNPTNNACNMDGLSGELNNLASLWDDKLDADQIGIPTANQLAAVEGKVLDNVNGYPSLDNSPWLTSGEYWTSTPSTNSYLAWYMSSGTIAEVGYVDRGVSMDVYLPTGIRPIITLDK